jgi:hypothetical protein
MTEYHRRHLDDREVHRRWMDPRIVSVRVADIQAYLLRMGWKPAPADGSNHLVFQEPTASEDGPLYQWTPTSEQRRDYTQRIYELIAAIAEVEDRFAGDVLADILSPHPAAFTNGPGASSKGEPAPR